MKASHVIVIFGGAEQWCDVRVNVVLFLDLVPISVAFSLAFLISLCGNKEQDSVLLHQ